MLTRFASAYFGDSAGEEEIFIGSRGLCIVDASKIDPEDIIDAKYDNIPEDCWKQFEAQLKKEQEESMRRVLACYERTQQGVIKKEEFIMPTFPSIATSEVSTPFPDLVEQFASP